MGNQGFILDFTFSAIEFSSYANRIISPNLDRLFTRRIDKLKGISIRIGEGNFKLCSEALIPHVFRKFKLTVLHRGDGFAKFNKKELRTLPYALRYSEEGEPAIFTRPAELDFAFELLEANWRDGFLVGLINCYLANWDSDYSSSLIKLRALIFAKLQSYEGSRRVLKSFKNNLRYFEENGDLLLGSDLALRKQPVDKSPEYLGLPRTWFTFPFFSKVLLGYYERCKPQIFENLETLQVALQLHNSSMTSRRVISKLILQANTVEFNYLKEDVKRLALAALGDPDRKDSIWYPFERSTVQEQSEIKNAKRIMLQWIAEQFITVFFEKCLNDPRRKRFWLKYSKEISEFRVVGSNIIKRTLLRDTRIGEFVLARFINVRASNDANAALMFVMRDHLFVEFSDDGAFYVYSINNSSAPTFNTDSYSSTRSLKNTGMPYLAYRTGRMIYLRNEEGRMAHSDGELTWEEVAADWIKEKAGIYV